MTDPNEPFDFAIIGAGIAGASAGYFLAPHGRVAILERESQPGYHTTGRSAALYAESYGNADIRALTTGGKRFYLDPPAGFTDHALLSDRGALYVGRTDQLEGLEQVAADASHLAPGIEIIDGKAACDIIPVLRPDYVAGAVLEPGAMDIDVHALHQGFLRGARAEGAELICDAEVTGLVHDGDWRIELAQREIRAAVVINAAGAWCDEIAALAGAAPVGLVPKRRTAIHFRGPDGVDCDPWPLCVDVDENFYFKPDAGKLIGSPADETPMPPCDVQPDELDIALTADRIATVTSMEIRRIENKWAGLRSFVADKSPVVGFAPDRDGFFWLAGQGGYGIQTAPAMGMLVGELARGRPVPADLADLGVDAANLAPDRPQLKA